MNHPTALTDYLARIGAEVLSFNKAMVKEYVKGTTYYIEKVLIKIERDGSIKCPNPEYVPTTAEADAIKEAFKKIDFPNSIGASKAAYENYVSSKSNAANFFAIWDRKKGLIVMAQERVEKEDGTKYFLPHSLWSDGEWRTMEPEGALPFWKPEKKSSNKIMIHEGCKAALFVHNLCESRKHHPWIEFLCQYEHWGILGGALAPHRADFSELHREKPSEVIYVCDNDPPGKAALQKISACYGNAMKGMTFGNEFPYAWDMADPIPPSMFSAGGFYIGAPPEKYLKFATRATKLVAVEGTKRRVAVLIEPFKEEWLHCVTPEVFVHKDWPDRILNAGEFNNQVAPFSDVDETSRLLKKEAASKSYSLQYNPGKPPGIYGQDGNFINTHVPSSIKPIRLDASPWLKFMEHLIVDEKDRHELMRWCATLIARPDIKMLYGVLLISEAQGIGKGTLGEKILAPLVGMNNVSIPSESEIVDSDFNYWLAHKRLAVVHEIYAGHSAKAYNKLKSVITDKYITVKKKYLSNYEIENWVHVFACSNSRRAIQLSLDDRRWFVPQVTEKKQSAKYWMELHRWISQEGLAAISAWAREFVKKHDPVLTGDAAPWSSAKREVIEEGYSPGMNLIARLFDMLNEQLALPKEKRLKAMTNGVRTGTINDQVIILDTDLVELVKAVIHEGRQTDKLERAATLRKVAKQKGWFVGPKVSTLEAWGCRTANACVLASSQELIGPTPGQLSKENTPLDVKAIMVL